MGPGGFPKKVKIAAWGKSNKKAEGKAKEEVEIPHLERWGNGGGKKGKMNNE